MKPIKEMQVDRLKVKVYETTEELGLAAATHASEIIQSIEKSVINLIFSTGASQFSFMDGLKKQTIDWTKIHAYHLDEYKDISPEHSASFRLWIRTRIEEVFLPNKVEYLHGDVDNPLIECQRYAKLLQDNPIDLGFIGIGENGHIAFNDPPVADFQDPSWVKVVKLDELCRRQQMGEGWFATLDDVPKEALTVTVPAILKCKKIMSIVPDERKAQAVRNALYGPISTDCPASILRTHPDITLYLDRDSASLILE